MKHLLNRLLDRRTALAAALVVGFAGGHRVAWLWLRQPNPLLGGRTPIDLLKQDRIDEVVDTARAYFDPQ